MDRPDPTQLLRSLEEEADTLRSMMGKVANTIHCLQVEDDYLSRQLANLEKAANEVDQPKQIDSMQEGFNNLIETSLEDFAEWTPTLLHPPGPEVQMQDTFGNDLEQEVKVDGGVERVTNGTPPDQSGRNPNPISWTRL